MKKFLLTLILVSFSFAAVAQMVFPNVWNNGFSVTLDAWNTSDNNVSCMGPIYLQMEDNTRETIHVYEFIFPRGWLYRTYYPRAFNTRIQYISHGIFCH